MQKQQSLFAINVKDKDVTPEIKAYFVKVLKKNPGNPGGGKRYEEQELRALAKSLRERQWMPLIVKEPEMYVLDGNRRHAAAELDGIETLFGITVTRKNLPVVVSADDFSLSM